jgi:hypothetical protein
MKKILKQAMCISALGLLAGCASMMTDDIAGMSAFNPYITKEGVQAFRFVAQPRLPSYYQGADVQETHEQWISNELGKRQYCLGGYEIVSVSEQGGMLVYEGVCS